MMLSIGNCSLGEKPRVAAVIDEFFSIDKLSELKNNGADLFEMRIDCYEPNLDAIMNFLSSVRNTIKLPMIGTVRENTWTSKDRVAIFRQIMPYVDCIDLELGTPISSQVQEFSSDKVIIVSEHDFAKTPDTNELNNMVSRALEQGADIIKIATMAHSRDDVQRLLWFTQKCDKPIVSIAMGKFGTVSRVFAPLFGSLFTYGYVTKPVAPGQLPVNKLIDEIRLYFPD